MAILDSLMTYVREFMSGELFWCDLIMLERFSLLHWSQQRIANLRKFLLLLKA